MAGVADNAASKAAIDGYAKGLARDLGTRGVTANVVRAGPMDTDLAIPSKAKLDSLIERLCVPRWGTVENDGRPGTRPARVPDMPRSHRRIGPYLVKSRG